MKNLPAPQGALLFCLLCLLLACKTVPPPTPFGALPSERQLAWHQMKYYAFIHFGPNTFTVWSSTAKRTSIRLSS